jgi:factor associated with neutral sphingomyelinase activation
MIYDIINSQTSIETQTNISIDKYSKLWIEGAISNYEYLILLNSAANRTRNDLSQYPIFPWVLSNYSSISLDLTNENNYRDLSKPIGALNVKRLKQFKERYNEMNEPKFLYGSHYSTPAYVIGYLVREFPYYMLKLHSGKFDNPDRLFSSIEIDWEICNSLSVKELIPEFYESDTGFLKNEKKVDFGVNSEGERIDIVKLPQWALNQNDFLRKMREALESDYVSKHLHEWIDLIFGYKQRGKEAVEADNCK